MATADELLSKLPTKTNGKASADDLLSKLPDKQPDRLGTAYRDALETTGLMAGGAIGGGVGTAAEPGLGTLAGGVAGAGLGRAAGTGLANILDQLRGVNQKTLTQQFQDVGESVGSGAVAQMGGEVAGVPINAAVGGAAKMLPRILQATADMPEAAGKMLVGGGPFPEGSPGLIQAKVQDLLQTLGKAKGKAAEGLPGAEKAISPAVKEVMDAITGQAVPDQKGAQSITDSLARSIPKRVGAVMDSLRSVKDEAGQAIGAAKKKLGIYKTLQERVDDLPYEAKKAPLDTIVETYKDLTGSGQEVTMESAMRDRQSGAISYEDFVKQVEQIQSMKPKDLTPENQIRELIHLRQSINDHVKYSRAALKPLTDAESGTLQGMAADINKRLDSIAASAPLRQAEGKYSKALNLYEQLQPSMATPGKAEEFLYKTFKGEKPTDRENMQALFALEKMSGGDSVRQLFKKFHIQGQEAARAQTVWQGMQQQIETPAKAQEFLYSLFKSKSPTDKEAIGTLASLDKLTGKPVVKNLFEKFSKLDAQTEAAKSAYSKLSKAMETPGKAEEFLYKTYKGTDPTDKENLHEILELERLSDKPIISELFDQFSGREIKKGLAGTRIRTTLGGLSLFALRAFGIPPAVSLPLALAAQSPAISSKVIPGALKFAAGMGKPVTAAAVSLLRSRRKEQDDGQ